MKKLYFLLCAMPLLFCFAEEGHDNSLKTERPIAENLPVNETLKWIEEKYKEMQEKDPLNVERFLLDLHRIAHKFRKEKILVGNEVQLKFPISKSRETSIKLNLKIGASPQNS
jgi:hypothetical protein